MARGLAYGKGATIAAILLVTTLATALAARQPLSRVAAGARVTVASAGCGRGWAPRASGPQELRLYNSGGQPAEAAVIVPATGAVVGEIDALGPDATRVLRLDLGPGAYALRCHLEGDDPVVGAPVRVRGSGRGGPEVVPVTSNDLYGPVRAYQKIVAKRLDTLVAKTGALRTAVRDGDRGAARDAWLPAHMAYERLGGAYGAFGDLGDAMNGTGPGATGFHRVEHGLWHDEAMTGLRGPADDLDRDARKLRGQWSDQRIDPLDLGLRAHEIMEDAERGVLTGQSDDGSGTDLATVSADLDGTRDVLSVLRPLLRTRDPGLNDLDAWLDRTDTVLRSHDHGGHWTSLDDLSPMDRQRVNGAVAGLLERLAPIAEICAPRRVS
ncbi:MAG TPA: EfeM/EfeO family lipoprotein [Streptosporangiaceae bacterium]